MLDTEQGWDLHCSISQHLSARAAGHARPITATAACSTSPRSIQPCANAQGQCTTRQALRQAGSAFQRRAEFERVLPKVSAFAGEMPIDCKVHPISLFLERSSLAQIALRTTDAREVVGIADIEGAERVMGVAYTEAERRQMLGNLEGQIISARARRKVRLDNSMPMASRFDPRLPSFRAPAPQRALRFASVVPKAVPDDDEDIAFAGIGQLSAWLSSGALTSRRLTEIYLARIDALGPRLECFATVSRDRALAEADAADALLRAGVNLGPLHGIPYGLKDLFDTSGITTGWGAEPFRNRVPDADATIVRKLRAAGAVLLGKTTVGALAYNDIWYGGWTRNPWNLNEGSSGSSAGSASATAMGLCAFAIGTETLGSITSPSQRCGTTGLRPTFGRISRAGGMALCWSLDKVGPICRSVEDTAMVLSAVNGADQADRCSIDAPFNFDADADMSRIRLGYLAEAFGEGANEVDRAALGAARGLGIEVVEVSLPDLPYGALMNILYAEAAAAFEELTLDDVDDTLTWQDEGAWPNTFRKARFLSAVDHVQLDRLRYRVMLALDELFADVDALIGPFMTGPMLIASNFSGHPCLHLRSGFLDLPTRGAASLGTGKLTVGEPEASDRTFSVPQGISLWGRLFEEGVILNLGLALERELAVAAARPTLAS
jgi:Asp-tRNA(Asn)/Glu-tRNA(Gln) amidotransferase A subunit family amidase